MAMTSETILSKNFPSGWLSRAYKAALVVFFFLLPLQTRYIFHQPIGDGVPYEYGTFSIFLVEVLGWVVIALGLIRMRDVKLKIKNAKWFILLIIFVFPSIFWAPDKVVALQSAVRLLEGVLLFFVLRSARIHSHEGDAKASHYIVYAFLTGALIQAGLGIFQFLTQSSFESSWLGMAIHDPRALGTAVVEFTDERWLRAYGSLPHPNILGGYLAVAFGIAVLLWQWLSTKDSPLQRTVLWVIISVILTGIFFSFSRAAWLAAGVVFVWQLWMLVSEYNTFARTSKSVIQAIWSASSRYWLLIIVYLVFLVLLVHPLISARVLSQSRLEIKSRVERVEGVREAWALIKKHPVAGVGLGNYTQAVAREVRPGQPLWSYQPVHNVPLLIWAELGIVGLALFLCVLYMLWRQSQNYPLLITFYILLIFDHYLWTLPLGILVFWAVLGLSTGYRKQAT